ncbi:MAG: APC family permease [Anaerolineae bacterium]|nr:APC family permease [Anaerolineae bacterium]GIK39070.1 MAG: amino acid permease [Chloroflexota bacterium]
MSEHNHKLRADIVTSLDAAAQSFGFVGPVFVMAFLTTFVAMGAGLATPLATLISGLASVAVGYVVAQFAIRHRAAGSMYTYIAQTFGPIQGFMGGWIYMFAVLMLTMAIVAGVAGWTSGFLADFVGINIHWLAVLVFELVVLFLLTYFDVRYSTRVQLTITAVSVVIVLALALTIIFTGGAEGNMLAPFLPGSAGGLGNLAFGLIFGMLLYTGYESAAVLAEEAKHHESIPLAVIGSAVLATVFYVIVTYAYAIGWGATNAGAWAEESAVLFAMGAMYWGDWAVPLLFAIAIIDAFAVAMACLNTVARVVYAMARDGALPRPLGRTHGKYQTPHIANGAVLILGLLAALAFIPIGGGLAGSWELEFGFLAGTGGIAVEIIYIYLAVAAIFYFRRIMQANYSIFKHLLVPIIAIIGPAAALYGSIQPQGGLLDAMPYAVLGWIIMGLILINVLRASQPEMVSKLGHDLGVEDVEADTAPAVS